MTPLLPISKNDTNIIKGIGILLIIFHNFFHWVAPSTGENEFYFSIFHVKNLLTGIIHTPFESINLLFSFFGFYGIVLFFFISAYGLTISYRKQANISYTIFIKTRILKLYPAFLGAVLGLMFWNVFVSGDFSIAILKSILCKLLLISNFIVGEELALTGPWWFFVCIMQFYLVFPLLMKGQAKYGNKFLILVSILGLTFRIAYIYIGGKLLHFVPFSFLPYLFELSLGIYLATVKEITISRKLLRVMAVLALLVFGAGCFFQGFWFFSAFAILVVFLCSYSGLRAMLQNNPLINKFLAYIGSISLYIFLMHGFLRLPLTYYAQNANFLGKIGYALLFFALSLIFAHLLQWMEAKVWSIWNNRKNINNQYLTLNHISFFFFFSKLTLLITAMIGLSLCCDLLFLFKLFPGGNSIFSGYLLSNIKVYIFIFPVLCLLGFALLFCFRKFAVWITLILFLGVTLYSNIEVLKMFKEYNVSWFIKSLFIALPVLIVLLASMLWNRWQKHANRLSIIMTAILLSISLIFTAFRMYSDASNQCYRYYQSSKAERVSHYLTTHLKIDKEVVFILTEHEGMFDTANNPENETQPVVVINSERLYQNIFSDNSMLEDTQSIEIEIEFQYYPVNFEDEQHLTIAYDINQSFLEYITIRSSKMKSNQWNNYKTKLFLSKSDGFSTTTENHLILYFYNFRKTKFYLRNCKVTTVYNINVPINNPKNH